MEPGYQFIKSISPGPKIRNHHLRSRMGAILRKPPRMDMGPVTIYVSEELRFASILQPLIEDVIWTGLLLGKCKGPERRAKGRRRETAPP